MTNPTQMRDDDDFDVDKLMDTFRAHRREFTIGGVALVVLVVGGLVWRQSALQKDARAETALSSASLSAQSGNRPLAMADLAKVADRYSGTDAGTEAAMLLAQMNFEDARYDDGVKVLEAAKKTASGTSFLAAIDGLIGGALSDQKKYDDAVKRYLAASDESEFQAMKDTYQADAARILAVAGKRDDAKKIWESIVSRPDSPVVGEAKVRLGELEVGPAKN